MKRMTSKWFGELEVTLKDIEIWYTKEGKICSGCIEGKLKEHAKRASTKPLTPTKPRENGVADHIFIEGRRGVTRPFYVHVDVATKLIIGFAMTDEQLSSKGFVVEALLASSLCLPFDASTAALALLSIPSLDMSLFSKPFAGHALHFVDARAVIILD